MNSRVQRAIEICHQRAHEAENDPGDYLFLSVTEREIWWLLAGMILASVYVPCSKEELIALEQRMADVIGEQKPQWREAHGLDE